MTKSRTAAADPNCSEVQALTVDPQDAAKGGHQVGIVEAADHAQPLGVRAR